MVSTSTNQYEVSILLHPDLEIDLEKATGRVEKIITDNGGTITNTDNWGKRKLAYPIQKHEYAMYMFYTVDMPGEAIRKIESLLNITDEVIRFLIVRPDLKKIAKAEALRADKAKKAEARKASGVVDDDAKDAKSEDQDR
jgi:small subunit ribosomal protein S6